jgi:hypothetical protein
MTSRIRNFRRGGRRADLAFHAPLVLLPFAWFALAACGDSPGTWLANVTTVKPDGQIGNTPYYNYPDHTRYGANVVCTHGGGYGGGSDAELATTRAAAAGKLQQLQNDYNEAKRTVEFCKNKTVTQAQMDAQQGCDRANHAPHLTHEQKSPAQLATYPRCVAAESAFYNNPCNNYRVENAQRDIPYLQAAIEREKARLGNIDACIKDKQRREQAQHRPAVNPAIILMNPGLFGPRPGPGRPSGGHGTGTHKE